ncbi:MAG TPA: threonine synthase [Brevefilum sp.]|nr:threonine synthase [Brevefilum sp.]HOR18726.1 threonine synthase [Brevefilum sp.]HPL68627.1 threonine synthase [Brevefilum sp.]
MKHKFSHYICSVCGAEYGPEEVTYTCPADGGNLNVILDYAAINARYTAKKFMDLPESSLWRYLSLLPVADPGGIGTPLRRAGWTPVYQTTRLAEKLGLKSLWIKDESPNPTASFKDRASAIVVARAAEIGAEVTVAASTGNAGSALAGMAAAVGAKAVIFAPRTAPPAKIAQLIIFGAKVLLVDGNYDQAFDLSIEATQAFGWYNRNTGFNPFTTEGKKTAGFEIWEQVIRRMPAESKPLTLFISVGDGNIISGVHKGFKDLQALGWLEKMPRIIGVQSTRSAAVANAFWRGDEDIQPVHAETLADSICVDLPRDGLRAVRAATETGGTYLTVSDEAILGAIVELGRVGIFAEPAASTAYAGVVKAVEEKLIKPDDPVLVLNTGSGLKDIKAAMQVVAAAPIIEPTLDALKKELG